MAKGCAAAVVIALLILGIPVGFVLWGTGHGAGVFWACLVTLAGGTAIYRYMGDSP